jgi:endonuclease/exonuclease/phosphatase family metal-dependent hydrolase
MTEQPERRQMLWSRLRGPDGSELAVGNLHGSVGRVPGASDQVIAAAERAVEWAGELPLVFGGDLNQSPLHQPDVFAALEQRLGLSPPTAPDAIDHLLVRGLEVVEPPHKLPDSEREVPAGDGLVLRLSDHACVAALAGMK